MMRKVSTVELSNGRLGFEVDGTTYDAAGFPVHYFVVRELSAAEKRRFLSDFMIRLIYYNLKKDPDNGTKRTIRA